jgi:hypothetical protein
VTRGSNGITVTGWACNYGHASSISVKAYARHSQAQTGSSVPFTWLAQSQSNKNPDAEMSFKCGILTNGGRKFSMIIPKGNLKNLNNHFLYIKGISNSGGVDSFIEGSGRYYIKDPARPDGGILPGQ